MQHYTRPIPLLASPLKGEEYLRTTCNELAPASRNPATENCRRADIRLRLHRRDRRRLAVVRICDGATFMYSFSFTRNPIGVGAASAHLGTTIVYVTHDQIEAMTLGDKIAVMKAGELMQFGTPQEIYDQPINMFVAGFMGSPPMNFIRCQARHQQGVFGVELNSRDNKYFLALAQQEKLSAWRDRKVILGVRPEKITQFDAHATATTLTKILAKVDIVEPTGPDTLVVVNLNGKETVCRVAPKYAKAPSESIELGIDLNHCVVFDGKSEARII